MTEHDAGSEGEAQQQSETPLTDGFAMWGDVLLWTGFALIMLVEVQKYPTASPRQVLGLVGIVAIWTVGTAYYPMTRGAKWAATRTAEAINS